MGIGRGVRKGREPPPDKGGGLARLSQREVKKTVLGQGASEEGVN